MKSHRTFLRISNVATLVHSVYMPSTRHAHRLPLLAKDLAKNNKVARTASKNEPRAGPGPGHSYPDIPLPLKCISKGHIYV